MGGGGVFAYKVTAYLLLLGVCHVCTQALPLPVVKRSTQRATVAVERQKGVYDGRAAWLTATTPATWGDDWEFGPFSATEDGLEFRLEFVKEGTDWREAAAVARVLDGWVIRARMRQGDNGPEVYNVELRALPGAQVVGTRVLNRLGFGAVADAASRWFADPVLGEIVGPPWTREVRRPGRGGADLHKRAQIAARYVRALDKDERRPYVVMCREAEARGEYVTEQALKATVHKARRSKPYLLTKAEPGKAGGELTELGKRLAREMGEEV